MPILSICPMPSIWFSSPGHGEVAKFDDVADFRAYLADLKHLVEEGRRGGLKDDALAQEVTPKLKALHPDWTINDRAAAAEVRYMDQELDGTKKKTGRSKRIDSSLHLVCYLSGQYCHVVPGSKGRLGLKAFATIGEFIWLLCGLAGAWMIGDLHWKPIVKGPITLSEAFKDDPVTYPGPN